jgi:hypothetical protein
MKPEQELPERIDEIRKRRAKVPEPPWFVSFDDAKERGPHRDSGLALVDTGRESDWPIARLCEWPQAEFIAHAPTDIDTLFAALEEAQERIATLRETADRATARADLAAVAPRCGVSNPGGVPCTKEKGHSAKGNVTHDQESYGPLPQPAEGDGEVFYPGIVDQKTLSACLETAEQIVRNPQPDRIERFKRTKAKLVAQIKAHPLSFDEWNAGRALTPPLPTQSAESDDYVAWCTYTYNEEGGIQTIVTCDSDAKGAFKVYRAIPVSEPSAEAQPEEGEK